jgi:hypothetical protein
MIGAAYTSAQDPLLIIYLVKNVDLEGPKSWSASSAVS